MRRKDDGSVRITSASKPRSEDIRGRERRYLISMGLRTVCFILAVVTMGHWVMWVFLVGAVFLPYVAVIAANGGAAPDPGGPESFDSDRDFKALGS
jgi:Flp pilus assembly protein TadB